MSQARAHKRPAPTVPAGVPVRAGAGAMARAMANSPQLLPDDVLMPPPPIPSGGSMGSHMGSSMGSSTSSRPQSFSGSGRYRAGPPLQDWVGGNVEHEDIDARFDKLLGQLQVPSTVRMKFATVTEDVKRSIIESSLSNPNILVSLGLGPNGINNEPVNGSNGGGKKLKNRLSTPLLRKPKSTQSLRGDADRHAASMALRSGAHSRGMSLDVPRPQRAVPGQPFIMLPSTPTSRPVSASPRPTGASETPEVFVRWLEASRATDLSMSVDRMKKLRMLLRHELTSWVMTFLNAGGYIQMLARIQDLLDIEWREEQHDDQMLYEILRCIKALTTSDVGKAALRAHHPRPFTGLSELLFSEKKPGELPCRQIIIELWLFHFELFPKQSAPGRPSAIRFDGPTLDVPVFIRGLLVNKTNKADNMPDFMAAAQRPRIFSDWVKELGDVCRDYFWVMCHGRNMLWALHEVNEKLVERPVAPGGATGGVEFEAMGYVTIQFRLLNALALHTAESNPADAVKLHNDLLFSGLDRILLTLRKASTTYYPTLHLELARYVDHLQRSLGSKVPYLINKMVAPPPEELRKHRSASEWLPRTQWEGGEQAQRAR